MQVTMSMMRKEFMTGTMDCDSAEMICGPVTPDHGRSRQVTAGHGWASELPSDRIKPHGAVAVAGPLNIPTC